MISYSSRTMGYIVMHSYAWVVMSSDLLPLTSIFAYNSSMIEIAHWILSLTDQVLSLDFNF